jgi:hypothetical protein
MRPSGLNGLGLLLQSPLREAGIKGSIRFVPPQQMQGGGARAYWLRQPCVQVCIWLSHVLRHGVLSVVGQTRLQDAFWLAQLAIHASAEVAASRCLLLEVLVPAVALATKKNRSPTLIASLIESLRTSTLQETLDG